MIFGYLAMFITSKNPECGIPGGEKWNLNFPIKKRLKNCDSVVKAQISQAESQWYKGELG